MAGRSCADGEHAWRASAVVGWFCCTRLLKSRPVLNREGYLTHKTVYCRAVAHCPGCLGFRCVQVPVALCASHQSLSLDALPQVQGFLG